MDNWIAFILGGLLTAIITLPIAIFGNLISPRAKSIYDRSIFASRKKRIARLIQDYKLAKRFRGNYPYFLIYLLTVIYSEVVLIGFAISIVGLMLTEPMYKDVLPSWVFNLNINDSVGAWMTFGFFTYIPIAIINSTFIIVVNIRNVFRIDSYKKRIETKIKKLGGNPEDLDKDEEKEEIKKTPKRKQHRRVANK